MSINSEALTLALSRRLAIADNRNQQQAMIHTARLIRVETKNKNAYKALGEFITCSDAEREAIAAVSEKMFLSKLVGLV